MDSLTEKVLARGWRAVTPQTEHSHPLSPSPGHPVCAPAGRCRACPSHRSHHPGLHHLLLHEEAAETVIPHTPGEGQGPPSPPLSSLVLR